eukprot:GHVS01031271.1.p1 GENE.GHVS01031271.1~~GHVS01031271.1.p1  ORF type:complete len:323 (-),score=91.20 GHVS01031271.1:114-1025(-)
MPHDACSSGHHRMRTHRDDHHNQMRDSYSPHQCHNHPPPPPPPPPFLGHCGYVHRPHQPPFPPLTQPAGYCYTPHLSPNYTFPSMRELCIDLPALLEQAKASSSSPAPAQHHPGHYHPDNHMHSVPPHLAPHLPVSAFTSSTNGDGGGVPTAASVVRHLPRVDVLGDSTQYVVEVELPGVEKKDVKLQMDEGRVITVSALHELDSNLERQLEQRQDGANIATDVVGGGEQKEEGDEMVEGEKEKGGDAVKWHVRERRRGMFERSMKMPPNVNLDKLEAKFNNGLLRIAVPKYQQAASVSIAIA